MWVVMGAPAARIWCGPAVPQLLLLRAVPPAILLNPETLNPCNPCDPLAPPPPQDKVVNSITELYAFMDSSNSTLDLKVLGEGGEEDAVHHDQEDGEEAGEEEARTGGRPRGPGPREEAGGGGGGTAARGGGAGQGLPALAGGTGCRVFVGGEVGWGGVGELTSQSEYACRQRAIGCTHHTPGFRPPDPAIHPPTHHQSTTHPPTHTHACPLAFPAAARKAAEMEEKRRALYSIMACMRDIRRRTDRGTDGMFEPLKETVALLHSFGIQLGDNVLQQLENAEFKWKVRGGGLAGWGGWGGWVVVAGGAMGTLLASARRLGFCPVGLPRHAARACYPVATCMSPRALIPWCPEATL